MKKKLSQILLLAGLICISLAVIVPGINAPFITTGEPREALVAQSMLLTGDPLQSVRYDHDVATKPPLFHWLMALLALVAGGLNETVSRLPSVLAATIVLVSWTAFSIPILGQKRALLGFSILLTSVEWVRNAAHARVDMLLAAMVTLALLFLYRWLQSEKLSFLLAATATMSLAALTKGPVGVALPAITAIIAMLLWRTITLRRCIKLSTAAICALLPLGSWYLAEALRTDGALLQVVINENWHRLLGTMSAGDDPHSHGVFYLVGAFIVGLLPWSLLAALPWFKRIKTRTTVLTEESPESKKFLQWCLIITGVCFVVFSIPSSKRSVYLLPAYPAATTLLAVELDRFFAQRKQAARNILLYFAAIVSLLWLLVIVLTRDYISLATLPFKQKTLEEIVFYRDLIAAFAGSGLSALLFIFIPLSGIIATVYLLRRRDEHSFIRLAALLGFFFVIIKVSIILPSTRALSPKDFIATELADHHPPEITLRTSRMYAEAFYIRLLQPELPVTDLDANSKFVLQREAEASVFPRPLYIHRSAGSVYRPGKHLEFTILNPPIPRIYLEKQ